MFGGLATTEVSSKRFCKIFYSNENNTPENTTRSDAAIAGYYQL